MTTSTHPDDLRAQYLRVYDEQLRTDAETPSAVAVTLAGPLRLVTFAGGRGFVTYRDLGGADEAAIDALVARPARTSTPTRRSARSSGRPADTTGRPGCTRRSCGTASPPRRPSRS